ncbi:IS110 family transposase [Streptomyces sp. NBC_01451]|uniref:IS110 family transposase n=1 Tax=Streptomyces sp. NBC_01451 TaxID=2903872 RepID=UPI003FCCF421
MKSSIYGRRGWTWASGSWWLACAPRAGTRSLETQRFETTAAEIRQLLAWLLELRGEVVVLEAASGYWRHLYYTLQPQLNLMLVNPARLKGIRGRKSDSSDASFLARAGASGMVMGSLVPRREIRELRDLTRCRTAVITARGREAQRLEKELEDTGLKLSSVISDITGATGRAIINALVQGSVTRGRWPTSPCAGPAARSRP